jgi:membrane protein YdbS with pleckstrin-like domain
MHLSPRAVAYFALQGLGPWLFFGFGIAIALTAQRSPVQLAGSIRYDFHLDRLAAAAVAVFALSSLLGLCCSYLRARSYRIEMQNEGVVLEYGVLNRNHEIILFKNIQDVLVSQGLVERLLGLSTVVIQNAMGKPETIPGLDAATAEALRNEIVAHAAR